MVTVDLHELNLKPNDVVLDAGCGEGETIERLRDFLPKPVQGIDLNPEFRDADHTAHTADDPYGKIIHTGHVQGPGRRLGFGEHLDIGVPVSTALT